MGRYNFQERFHRNEPMTKDEYLTMLNAAETPTLSALIAFLYLYGARVSEACRLEKRDFEVQKAKLRVRVPTLKAKDPDAFRMLRVRLDALGADRIMTRLNDMKGPRDLFYPWSRITAWRHIHRLNPDVSPHWFRHTRATRFAEQSTDQLAIQAWFGWRDPRTPLHYIQISGKLADRLSGIIE